MSSSQFDVETALHPKVILDILVKAAQGVFHAREILPERRVPSRTVHWREYGKAGVMAEEKGEKAEPVYVDLGTWTDKSATTKRWSAAHFLSYDVLKFAEAVDVAREVGVMLSDAIFMRIEYEVFNLFKTSTAVGEVTSTAAWDATSGQDILLDIENAKEKILRDGGVEPDTLIVNAYDYKSMITKDAKIRELARSTGKALDDIIPMLFPRLEIIKTSVKDTLGNYLLDDYAIVLARGSETGNIFVASPLEVIRVENELKRGWDYAVYYDALPVLTRPKRVCRIKNTKA